MHVTSKWRDRDGKDILIPNETLLDVRDHHWSHGDRNVRFRLPVQISYQNDPETAMAIWRQAARATARAASRTRHRSRASWDSATTASTWNWRLWVSDPENGVNNVRSDTYVRIWHAFRAKGISIPYPQRDVRLIPERAARRFPRPPVGQVVGQNPVMIERQIPPADDPD